MCQTLTKGSYRASPTAFFLNWVQLELLTGWGERDEFVCVANVFCHVLEAVFEQ